MFSQVTAFSAYCEKKFEIEPVQVTDSDGKSFTYPDLSVYNLKVPLSYINGAIGVNLEAEEVCSFFSFVIVVVAASLSLSLWYVDKFYLFLVFFLAKVSKTEYLLGLVSFL